MGEGERSSLGAMRATISNEIVRLQAEYYGKGPTKAKTYIVEDLVVVVLEESFTRAEKTLVERGEREAIEHIRRRFQQQMAAEFTSVVEQATGGKVRVFLSETDSTRTYPSRRSSSTAGGRDGLASGVAGCVELWRHNLHRV